MGTPDLRNNGSILVISRNIAAPDLAL